MNNLEETYDAVVIGAGHAGCEAALALARMGIETIIFTVSMDSVAMMPCNPNIGGSSKGHLVREIDALGGEMGKNIDKTYIQSKMLNRSKGPAVHSLRAQADKVEYTKQMRITMQNTDHLTLRQAEVSEIIVDDSTSKKRVRGVRTKSGATYYAKAVIICTGVYLNARCIYGDVVNHTGPNGLSAATFLSDSLVKSGIPVRRFKTGTPARIDKRSIDFSKMEEQFGDEKITPFSFTNKAEDIAREQISCWLTYTNETTHDIIRANIDRSPLFSGAIEGTGPRYCPSIEDKVMKFADKNRHQVFIEPEGEFTNEMYIGGMSSSLPEDVQYAMYRSVPGLENAKIVRNAYAIEYDCISALMLKHTLEFKDVDGLYSAGQMNGSSGYEEAGAQGIMAGINAARKLQGKEEVVLDRSQAYIGVLIDDLVTKETKEPYRMMTSRAEYRLLLRQDNADLRLTDIGHDIGLISDERYDAFCKKRELINSEVNRLSETMVGGNKKVQAFLEAHDSTTLKTAVSLADIIKRPELDYESIEEIDAERVEIKETSLYAENISEDVINQINIEIKYDGYIKRQQSQVEHFKKLEDKKIPASLDYNDVSNLRKEARQKLNDIRPENIGQASRISGVSPADISVLLIYLNS
ncbi:MAG: tRNA uridine-5-carboxymethylaminomethyl(34) synthesis enzyme MnmG [Lachnospiraceae bacterium]|jgi:tRNA uridine 5-carboxymethylaminomethyl modification enzyme|nr:tRNA uridine-5-carboxymethylaminomethyl(34) synthesis enzyme MnmG [Lachnospiraceae bacterium]